MATFLDMLQIILPETVLPRASSRARQPFAQAFPATIAGSGWVRAAATSMPLPELAPALLSSPHAARPFSPPVQHRGGDAIAALLPPGGGIWRPPTSM
ncbi:hypothetical protein [Oryza sativa Japonica Group]|uniref:Uncharacterized protein n=1 Tax=Oryza sativa subsp. japonica TaxID=39947 RepID=Q8LI75_ORYSJ|nr:hypothetical protein [Oryza sativa Japonica Group]BAD69074.1 hypothetical protein [Oryza sativa Japonica Group]